MKRPSATRQVLAFVLAFSLVTCATAATDPNRETTVSSRSPEQRGSVEAQKKKQTKPNDKDPQYQYEKGVIALNYGLPDEAIRYGNLAVTLDPNHYGGWSLLGNAYYRKGAYADAAAAYEKAVALRPDLAEAHTNLGLSYLETGALDKAEAELKKGATGKKNAIASFTLAKLYFKQGRNDEALAEVQESIAVDGRNAGAYNLKGVILNQLERFAEAAGSFQAGLVLAPKDTNLQVNLGIAWLNAGDPEKARSVLEKVLPQIENPAVKAKVEEALKTIKN